MATINPMESQREEVDVEKIRAKLSRLVESRATEMMEARLREGEGFHS